MSGILGHRGLLMEAAGTPSSPPVHLSTLGTFFGTTGTSFNVPLGSTWNAGDLILIQFATDGTTLPTVPSGYTQIPCTQFSTESARNIFFYKTATGSEGGTTVNVNVGVVENAAAEVHRIQAGTWGAIELASSTEGMSTAVLPPPITPVGGVKPYLFIACNAIGNRVNAYSAWPYVNGQTQTEAGTSGSQYATIGSCWRTATTGTETPTQFTINIARGWMAYTIAIAPP